MIPYRRSAMMSIVPTQEESPSARILESILARIDQARTFTFLQFRTNIHTNRTSGARARTQLLLQQDVYLRRIRGPLGPSISLFPGGSYDCVRALESDSGRD